MTAGIADAYVVVSQSGRSAETLAAVERVAGAPVLSVCSSGDSPVARAASGWLPLGDLEDTPLSTLGLHGDGAGAGDAVRGDAARSSRRGMGACPTSWPECSPAGRRRSAISWRPHGRSTGELPAASDLVAPILDILPVQLAVARAGVAKGFDLAGPQRPQGDTKLAA